MPKYKIERLKRPITLEEAITVSQDSLEEIVAALGDPRVPKEEQWDVVVDKWYKGMVDATINKGYTICNGYCKEAGNRVATLLEIEKEYKGEPSLNCRYTTLMKTNGSKRFALSHELLDDCCDDVKRLGYSYYVHETHMQSRAWLGLTIMKKRGYSKYPMELVPDVSKTSRGVNFGWVVFDLRGKE